MDVACARSTTTRRASRSGSWPVPPVNRGRHRRRPARRARSPTRTSTRLRQLLCHEPRGHADMYGGFVVPPDDAGADLGVLFWHKDGFSTACGHGTIALGAWAVDSGRGRGDPTTASRDVSSTSRPAGSPPACTAGRAASVASRLRQRAELAWSRRDVPVPTSRGRGRRRRRCGGAIYASLPRRAVGLSVDARATSRADRDRPRDQVGAQRHRARPAPDATIGCRRLRDDPVRRARPTPTGAAPAQRDDLRRRRGRPFAVRVGHLRPARGAARRRRARRAGRCSRTTRSSASRFLGAVVEPTDGRRRAAVLPEVTGMAYRTGEHAFVVDPRRPARARLRAAVTAACPSSRPPTSPRCVPPADAVAAIQAALLGGLDPAADPPRGVVAVAAGQLLLMPSAAAGGGGRQARDGRAGEPGPRAAADPGRYVLFDADTLAPLALLDGTALDHAAHAGGVGRRGPAALLPRRRAATSLVFGAGPQGGAHVATLQAPRGHRRLPRARTSSPRPVRAVPSIPVLAPGSRRPPTGRRCRDADVVVCATTAREPLFDGRCSRADAVVSRSARTSPTRARSTARCRPRARRRRGRARRRCARPATSSRPSRRGARPGRPRGDARRGHRRVTLGRDAPSCSRAPGWRGRTSSWPGRSSLAVVTTIREVPPAPSKPGPHRLRTPSAPPGGGPHDRPGPAGPPAIDLQRLAERTAAEAADPAGDTVLATRGAPAWSGATAAPGSGRSRAGYAAADHLAARITTAVLRDHRDELAGPTPIEALVYADMAAAVQEAIGDAPPGRNPWSHTPPDRPVAAAPGDPDLVLPRLERLPQRSREVLVLRAMVGLSSAQVARGPRAHARGGVTRAGARADPAAAALSAPPVRSRPARSRPAPWR